MAILSSSPGLEVQIFIKDEALREYEDRTAKVAAKTWECYVEARSRQNFEIRWGLGERFPGDRAVSMIVTIDGKDVDEPLIHPEELYEEEHISAGPVSKGREGWKVQRYCFAPIRIEEANAQTVPEELKKRLDTTGIITCQFHFLDNPQRNRGMYVQQKEIEEIGTVSEKAIKGDALSHQAILGDHETTEEIEYFDAEYDDGGEPFATFHFYYRSLSALQDLHIISRPTDPIEILDDDNEDISQLTREQLEAEVRRLHEHHKRMKRERSESVTVVGDDDDVGTRIEDQDCVAVQWTYVRKKRRTMRVPQVPAEGIEVIFLDD